MPLIDETQQQQRAPAVGSGPVKAAPAPSCKIIGNWSDLPPIVSQWVADCVTMCQPACVHVMTGAHEEDLGLRELMVKEGVLTPLKYDNCHLVRTDPKDVARVESRTVICTEKRIDSLPDTAEGVQGKLGHWISPADLDKKVKELFPGCMRGRVVYVVPFSMGPIGGPLSKNGVELTDSAYVASSMVIMTRVSTEVLKCIEKDGFFVKCLHSVGVPVIPGKPYTGWPGWPCNPENTIIAHKPDTAEIISFGSGYGGNSLLGKKCFSLRIGSTLAHKQGWLAEHMLIMGVKKAGSNTRRYVTGAFPSCCGKTNLAMLRPALKDFEITCCGDDIAWLRFDDKGDLRAINPENGFFGVAPGTNYESNPVAMETMFKDALFTNVALTDDMGVWWEGLTDQPPAHLIDWNGKEWTPDCGRKASHPNSRFTAPARNCPILDENWEDPKGVKIEAILFGGRRPEGVPLVTEAFSWQHGVYIGSSLKSEATAAAEHKGKVVMHDPFSMRPFFGYNFGKYLEHWLKLGEASTGHKCPKIFVVNWFRRAADGGFLWPGFGDNIRVIDWVLRRCDGEDIAENAVCGLVPKKGSINLEGLKEKVEWEELFSTPKDFWVAEAKEVEEYFKEQVGSSLPAAVAAELKALEERAAKM